MNESGSQPEKDVVNRKTRREIARRNLEKQLTLAKKWK